MALKDRITPQEAKTAVQLKLPNSLVEKLDQMAADNSTTRTAIVTAAIEELYDAEYE